MKKHLTNFKNIFLTLAFMLTFSASAWAQDLTLYEGQNYPGDISISSTTFTSKTYTIHVNSGFATISGKITATCNGQPVTIKKTGNGSLILTNNNNSMSGGDLANRRIVVDGGIFQIGSATTGWFAGVGVVTLTNTNSTLRFYRSNENKEFSSNITGSGKLEKAGDLHIFLTGTCNHTGGTTIESGAFVIGNNGTTGSLTGIVTVNKGTHLGFWRSNAYTCEAIVIGNGGVTKYNSAGNITFSAFCAYEGQTNIYGGGKFILTGAIEKSSDVWLMESTSKFEVSSWKRIKNLNSNKADAEVILNGTNGTLCVGNINGTDGGGTYAGKITGAGKFHKDGSGTLTLSGNNTYTGETGIYWGTVVFSANSLGTGNIYFRGAQNSTLRWAAGNTTDISGRIKTDKADAPITFDTNGNEVTFASVLPGITGKITKAGTGYLILCGNQTYAGATEVAAGSLQLGTGGGTAGNLTNTSGVEVKTGALLVFSGSGTTTFAKKITGAGKVYCAGTASKINILTANNDYTGGTEVKTNTILYIGNNTTTGAVAGNIVTNTGSWVDFRRSNDYKYTGIISGSGSINKYQGAKLTLTGNNTYTGITAVTDGELNIGDNTTTGSIANSSEVKLEKATSTLVLAQKPSPGAAKLFGPKITGVGKVTVSQPYKFTNDNTYTGVTTVKENGALHLGNGSTTGAITGDVVVEKGALLGFNRTDPVLIYSKISGEGYVYAWPDAKVTLMGVNTYSGITDIAANGSLTLGTTGTIENSSYVNMAANAKFNINADKKIKGLASSQSTAEVSLYTRILTISNSVNYSFSGKFSGTSGGVTKTGTGLFIMSGINTTTGLFSLTQGKVQCSAWAGNFTQATGTTLDVKSTTTVGGNLTLQGGEITMNLTSTTPSKINVMGGVYASGKTKLTIATSTVTNKAIMQAASGLTPSSLDFFTLNLSGVTGTLAATGTELLLTATITDNTPPTPGAGVNGAANINSANLSWGAAQDNVTPAENLRYFVYQSNSNNINTPANCETNGTLLNSGGTVNITSYEVLGLNPNTTYYFNVVVADLAGNKAAYTTKQLVTSNEPKIVSVTISPNSATMAQGETKQFTATVVAVGGSDETVEWSISGNSSGSTTITSSGLLTVDSEETSETIKVKAVSYFDPSVYDEITVKVNVVGIATNSLNNQITVYPNPTSGELTIDNGELTIKNVEVYDIAGKKLFVEQNSYGLTILRSYDLTHFPAGTYFVKITTEQGVVTKKVIKH